MKCFRTYSLDHNKSLGPIYIKRQRQRCDNSAMMIAVLFSLKTMESLQNGLQPIFKRLHCFQ